VANDRIYTCKSMLGHCFTENNIVCQGVDSQPQFTGTCSGGVHLLVRGGRLKHCSNRRYRGLGKRYRVIQEITQHLIKYSVHVTHVHAQVCITFTTHNTTFTGIILPSSTTGLLTSGGNCSVYISSMTPVPTQLVGWRLTSLFSTNMVMSEKRSGVESYPLTQ